MKRLAVQLLVALAVPIAVLALMFGVGFDALDRVLRGPSCPIYSGWAPSVDLPTEPCAYAPGILGYRTCRPNGDRSPRWDACKPLTPEIAQRFARYGETVAP